MGWYYIQNASFPNLQHSIVALGLTVASAANKWLVKITCKLCILVLTSVFMSSKARIMSLKRQNQLTGQVG